MEPLQPSIVQSLDPTLYHWAASHQLHSHGRSHGNRSDTLHTDSEEMGPQDTRRMLGSGALRCRQYLDRYCY
jgi:hypothetical protein